MIKRFLLCLSLLAAGFAGLIVDEEFWLSCLVFIGATILALEQIRGVSRRYND